jgi:archaellum component FlaD/FlaE
MESIARLFGGDGDEADETETEGSEPAAGDLDFEPAPVEEPTGPDTTELSNRIDDLEDEIESTATSLSAIRNAQEETADSVEEVNDTVRRLAGIYDQVAAAENPFVDGGDGADGVVDGGTVSFDDLDGAGEDHADGAGEDHADGAGEDHADGAGEDHADGAGEEDATEADGRAAAPEAGDAAHGDADAAAHEAGNGTTDAGVEPWEFGETEPGPSEPGPPGPDAEPLVGTVPPGYAGDLLVMEWLSRLMDRSGPAGALRAVEHYHDLGLVSEAVRDHVVAVLGGPSLDVFVDPTRPHEPTIEEHGVSNTYLHALRDLED